MKYLCVGRKPSPTVYAEGEEFEIGKGVVLREGGGRARSSRAASWSGKRAQGGGRCWLKEGVAATVVDMFTVKPLDRGAGGRVLAEEDAAAGGDLPRTTNRVGRPVLAAVSAVLVRSASRPVPVGLRGRRG